MGALSVHVANHFYGHAGLLARWCGLDGDSPPRVPGCVQHRWDIDGDLPYVTGMPMFVWSAAARSRAHSLGRQPAVVIGATWLYLDRLEPELGRVPDVERQGTIFYPCHGGAWPAGGAAHQRLISLLAEVERGPVTVCLSWADFHSWGLRWAYRRAGFRVICHGRRGPGAGDGDGRFRHRQLAELRHHRRVASNRLGSALWYGIQAGCEPAVYGDPMLADGRDPTVGSVARARRMWPDLHGTAVDLPLARQAADVELGARFVAEPAELRELFGWPAEGTGELRRAAAGAWQR